MIKPDQLLTPQQHAGFCAAAKLAETCNYEAGHAQHITSLSLQLYDQLLSLHQYTGNERYWLMCAGILHDIGWMEGGRAHHKTGLHIILSTPLLPFDSRERLIIGSIVRYHRKAMPHTRHDHYAALHKSDQRIVKTLSVILRLANSLDHSHQQIIRHIRCKVTPKRIALTCFSSQSAPDEKQEAGQELKCFASVFTKKVSLKFRRGERPRITTPTLADVSETQPI